jgi:hypothetical protein
MTDTNFETGVCNYTIKFKVYSHTSGNELSGPQVLDGEFETHRDAEEWLANRNGNFTLVGPNQWRGGSGYTRAYIQRVVEYDFK